MPIKCCARYTNTRVAASVRRHTAEVARIICVAAALVFCNLWIRAQRASHFWCLRLVFVFSSHDIGGGASFFFPLSPPAGPPPLGILARACAHHAPRLG